jgi:hypothetical protein
MWSPPVLPDLIIDLFKGDLKNAAAGAIQNALTNALNDRANQVLASFHYRYNFTQWGTLDYSLTGPVQMVTSLPS